VRRKDERKGIYPNTERCGRKDREIISESGDFYGGATSPVLSKRL